MANKMVKYKYPEPRECLNCGSDCYARTWRDHTWAGRLFGRDVVKVSWKCSGCGRTFQTMEHLNDILMESDEPPQTRYQVTFIEIEEESEKEKNE